MTGAVKGALGSGGAYGFDAVRSVVVRAPASNEPSANAPSTNEPSTDESGRDEPIID